MTESQLARERAQAWLLPIAGAAPSGSSAKDLPGYEAVLAEIAKLQSPSATSQVDWVRVVAEGGDLLRGKSKDLLIASYVAFGLSATGGLAGLAEGMALLAGLLEQYWPTLFPEATRLRARANALVWFVERATAALAEAPAGANQRELVSGLRDVCEQFAQASREKLAALSPGFGPLLAAIDKLLLSMPTQPLEPTAPKADPTPSPETPKALVPELAPLTAPTPALDAANGVDFLRTMGTALAEAADTLRRANASDPTPYRILRLGLWLHLDDCPPPGPNGRTGVAPLADSTRAQLEAMARNQKWAELLEEAESLLTTFRFNLDLHRFAALALQRLGPDYAPARAALLAALQSWLARAPGAAELTCQDGSPAADAETKAWLQSEVPASAGRGVRSLPQASATPPTGGSIEEQVLAEASALSARGALAEAIALVDARLPALASERGKFVARLQLARLCADGGHLEVAKALYRSLDAQSRQHALDVWDPPLATACLEGLLACIRSANPTGALPSEYVEPFERLCRLSVTVALSGGR